MSLNDIAVLASIAVMFIDSLALIWYLNRQNAPVRTTVVQFLAIVVLLPLVFVLAFTGKVSENTISTLLGSLVGYIFGKTSLTEEWTHTKQG